MGGSSTDSTGPRELMGSFFGLVSTHIDNLSGERLDPVLPKRIRRRSSSRRVYRQPNISIVGSSNPTTDSNTVKRLFPSKFRSEKSQDSVLLVESQSAGPLHLLLVDCQKRGGEMPVHWKNATLFMREKEIRYAMEQCRGKHATVFHHESIEDHSSPKWAALTVIRLSGGANLVLMTPSFLRLRAGRAALTRYVAVREQQEAADHRNVGASLTQALQDEDFLKELEEECDPRYMRRRSSADMPKSSQTSSTLSSELFPTLSMSLQRKHGFMQNDIPINTSKPITFETDLFVGKILILMRPEEPDELDPIYQNFFADNNERFVLQLQGKFKYVPQGPVYAGIELTQDMKPALVAKSLCGLILRNIRKKYPNVHYSYGDEHERPHIVVPAWTFFDRMVVSNPRSEPPEMDQLFPEALGSVKARQASGSKGAWNTKSTYSFSACTSFMDFPTWNVVNLGFSPDVDLHVFWADSPVRLVLYEHRDSAVAPYQHLQQYNHYLMSLQINHADEDVSEDGASHNWRSMSTRGSMTLGRLRRSVIFESFTQLQEELQDLDSLPSESYDRLGADEMPTAPSKTLLEKADALCPAWVETVGLGKHVKLFAFVVNKGQKVILRSPSDFQALFSVRQAMQYVSSTSSPRISSSEEMRRVFGYVFSEALAKEASKARQFAMQKADIDSKFLRRRDIEVIETTSHRPQKKSGYIARALSERHWKEEYVRLFDNHMAFFHPERTRPHFRIYLNTVMKVRRLGEEECPVFPGFAFLEVETLGRTEYLMFADANERNGWERTLSDAVLAIKQATFDSPLEGIDDPTEQFLHKSSTWNCQQRRILNCRRFYFEGPTQAKDPSAVLEAALVMAYEAQENDEQESLLQFLDAAAALKNVDIYCLVEKERLAFFLNLYHLMIMHSYLLLGPPETSFKFDHMFQMVSYQLSDDIFTIAELEHNIIRAAMGYPSHVGAKLSLPKSQFDFALKHADYRINFALNSGSLSCPPVVQIFKGQILDFQLDSAAIRFMEAASVETFADGKVVVTLPQVCQWYIDDFGDDVFALLEKIEKSFDEDKKRALKAVEDDERNLIIKYEPFIYECRRLVLEGKRTRKSFFTDPFSDSDFVSEDEELDSVDEEEDTSDDETS